MAISDQHRGRPSTPCARRRSRDRGGLSHRRRPGCADQGCKPVGDPLPAGGAAVERSGDRVIPPSRGRLGRLHPRHQHRRKLVLDRPREERPVGPVMIDPRRGFLDGAARFEHHAVGELLDREMARRRAHAVEHLGDLVEHRQPGLRTADDAAVPHRRLRPRRDAEPAPSENLILQHAIAAPRRSRERIFPLMEQKRSSIEAIDHRLQVSPRERVGVDEHDMAGRAAGQPAQRLDLRTISILRRTAPLAKRRRLEMLDRNRILRATDSAPADRSGRRTRRRPARGPSPRESRRAPRCAGAASIHRRTTPSRVTSAPRAGARPRSRPHRAGSRVRQRKSPGAQTRWSHGRQGSSPASTASLGRSLLRHGRDRTGSVGPYSATIGTLGRGRDVQRAAVAADVERRGIDQRAKLGQRKLAAAEHALGGRAVQPGARVRDDPIDGIGFRWSGGDHDPAVLGRRASFGDCRGEGLGRPSPERRTRADVDDDEARGRLERRRPPSRSSTRRPASPPATISTGSAAGSGAPMPSGASRSNWFWTEWRGRSSRGRLHALGVHPPAADDVVADPPRARRSARSAATRAARRESRSPGRSGRARSVLINADVGAQTRQPRAAAAPRRPHRGAGCARRSAAPRVRRRKKGARRETLRGARARPAS